MQTEIKFTTPEHRRLFIKILMQSKITATAEKDRLKIRIDGIINFVVKAKETALRSCPVAMALLEILKDKPEIEFVR